MSCESQREALGDYVDGALSPEARDRLEQHLASCEACRALAADLKRIRQGASDLPPAKPSDRVWMRIATELESRGAVQPAGSPRRSHAAGGLGAWFRRLAAPVPALAAAVVLLAVVAGYLALSRGPAAPAGSKTVQSPIPADGSAGPSAGVRDKELVRSVAAELQLAEQHYEKAIAGLEQITSAGQGNLDPQVAEALQRNMLVIDQAIRDSKQALESQPTSQPAQESLFEAFRRKVALLQDVVALINEMRKGNEAGAARIIGNLNK
jgi:hypothetical protein